MTATVVPIFRALNELHQTLGVLHAALGRRDEMVVKDQLYTLVKKFRLNQTVIEPVKKNITGCKRLGKPIYLSGYGTDYS